MVASYHCILCQNTTIEENDSVFPHCLFIIILLLRDKKEVDDNLLPSPLSLEHHQKRK